MRDLDLEGNRRERLKQLKKGPGVFVYDGSAVDTEWTPTMLLTTEKEPVFKDDGTPSLDRSGRVIMKPAGQPVYGDDGQPKMGGKPKVKTLSVDVYRLWGVEFPKGEPVKVDSPKLALKLRCMPCFEEVEEGAAPKKRGRPKKQEQAEA